MIIGHIERALELARDALGTTWPNPAVGCVIVKNGQIIGEGQTAKGGRPHAEIVALAMAQENASDAEMYVTLEPCCHIGKSGACTDAIIKSGIKEIFIATKDPYKEVAGKGIQVLKEAGIEVHYGLKENEANIINEGFFQVQKKSRPFVTLKLAMSIDGKIATKTGDSKWISNEKSRNYSHKLRKENDAILVGIGTIIKDDPLLNCRLPNYTDVDPVRIILDSHLKISKDSKIIKTADKIPTWIYSTEIQNKETQIKNLNPAEIINCQTTNAGLDLEFILQDLAKRGITRILVEGGSQVATSFLASGLVDRLLVFRAPIIIGNDGIAAISPMNNILLVDAPKLNLKHIQMLDDNILEEYGV